jgi:thiol-disulfide isomerase/thioredoxin
MATKASGAAVVLVSLFTVAVIFSSLGGCLGDRRVTVPYNEVGKDFLIYWQRYNFLILFYVPWCEYSKAIDPVFYELADGFANTSVNVAKCDVSEWGDVSKFFKVSETPTIKFLKQGIIYNFDGLPAIGNLLGFVSRVLSPEVRTINTTHQLDAWKGNFSVLFMLLQPEKINPDWENIYKQVAKERIVESVFLQTNNPDIVSLFGVKHTPTLLVLKDSSHYEYKDSLSSYSMGVWADSEKFPACPSVNYTTAKLYLTRLSPGKKVVVFSTPTGELLDVDAKYVGIVKGIALERNFQRGYQFVWNVGEELLTKLTNEAPVMPSLIVWDPETGYHYAFDEVLSEETFTKKAIVRFLLAVSKGSVEPKGGIQFSDRLRQFYAFANGVIWVWIAAFIWHGCTACVLHCCGISE